jgi:hypothetical protein
VGPSSSVSKMPPTLFLTRLPVMTESVTPCKWSASPQSSGSVAGHCGLKVP